MGGLRSAEAIAPSRLMTPAICRARSIMPAAVAVDNLAVEVLESIPPDDLPIHRIGIRDMGLYLLELLDLNELAADKAYESLVVIAPLRISGGAGSPVNPIAIT